MNVAGHDADLTFSWGDQPRAVGADQSSLTAAYGGVHAHHIQRGHSFRNGGDDADAGVERFHDSIRRERCRDKDHRGVGAGGRDRLFDRLEHREPFDGFATLAGRDASHHVRTVFQAPARVESTCGTGDTLANHACRFVDQDAHGVAFLVGCRSVGPSRPLCSDLLRMRGAPGLRRRSFAPHRSGCRPK